MKNSWSKFRTAAITATLSVAIALIPKAEASTLIQKELFFGRNIANGEQVSEEEFQAFVDAVITPLFPEGLTVSDAKGHFLSSTGVLIEEPSKVVTLFVEDTAETEAEINQIVTAYVKQFDQESVLQTTNEDELKVGFGAGENLIDNDPIPEFIQADLFFGRNIAGGGEVSEAQFETFLDEVITPRFPAGLIVFEAEGQFQDSTGTIIEEQSKVVRLLLDDTVENEAAIDEIIIAYIQRFNQESVLVVVDEDIEVAFDAESPTDVPEPGASLGLLAIALLGTGTLLKNRTHTLSLKR